MRLCKAVEFVYHAFTMKSKQQGQEWKVSATEADQRLDKWLAAPERLASRSKSLNAIERGKVFVNDTEQTSTDAARRVVEGDRVRLWHDRPGSATKRYFERHDSGLHILYEDASLLVINKPAGLLTVPLAAQPDEPSLLNQVEDHLRSARRISPLVVHRIDRDTSGLVVFAKTNAAMSNLKDQFEKRQPERVYLAFVYGVPKEETGSWKDMLVWDQEELKQRPLAHRPTTMKAPAKSAITNYRVIEKYGTTASLLEIRLVTGKRNQIRVQASLHGYPLIGEKMYRDPNRTGPRIELARQALHAWQLSFIHPTTGQRLRFEAPLPQDLLTLQLRLKSPS